MRSTSPGESALRGDHRVSVGIRSMELSGKCEDESTPEDSCIDAYLQY